ncbi:MAG TPA: GNAT family N-acetyltransferase [Opitutaceae bacterium]
MATSENLLARLDEERRSLDESGFVREADPRVTRHISRHRRFGFVTWSALPAADLTAAIEREITFFKPHVDQFEWKTYDHDGPPGLTDALVRAGFKAGESETAMVADSATVATLPLTLPEGIVVRKAKTSADLADVVAIENAVWNNDRSSLAEELGAELRANPDRLHLYIAADAGTPVSCAWVRLNRGSAFAGLWGGSTLAAWRGRGIYRHLLIRRARDAVAAGYPTLYVDASPDSRPILERNGFTRLTGTRPYVYMF